MIRFTNAFATGVMVTGLVLGLGVLGCSSDGGSQSAPAEKPAAAPAKAATPKGASVPSGSKLSHVAENMSPDQVQEIMGAPSGQASYPSAKTFNPYNFGNDSGNRVEYKYKGQGRIVFAVPKYGGNMKVVRVDYDPSEDGN